MKTISEWQREAHALAVEKGFYQDKDKLSPTFIGSRLALIHREISEATECVCRGKMDAYVSGFGCDGPFEAPVTAAYAVGLKPEGFPIELADVFLRLCDFAESVGVSMDEPCPEASWTLTTPEEISDALNSLHTSLASVSWTGPGTLVDGYAMSGFLWQLLELARATNVDLLAMAELKTAYNRTRPKKHGKVL